MGLFNTKTTLYANPSLIPAIADRICSDFAAEGFEISRDNLITGGIDISITKGGMFKAVIGMKTALKVTLLPQGNSIEFDAGVGIFGQQAIPTLISMFITWPVLLTQIWGLVQQSKLDDKALASAQAVIAQNSGYTSESSFNSYNSSMSTATKFCTSCGAHVTPGSRFCSNCGAPLN